MHHLLVGGVLQASGRISVIPGCSRQLTSRNYTPGRATVGQAVQWFLVPCHTVVQHSDCVYLVVCMAHPSMCDMGKHMKNSNVFSHICTHTPYRQWESWLLGTCNVWMLWTFLFLHPRNKPKTHYLSFILHGIASFMTVILQCCVCLHMNVSDTK